MNSAEDRWQHLGRAAEHFARRVARDARQFAERVEKHAGEFAHDVRDDWHCGRRTSWSEHASGSAEDVQRVFQDIRGVLASVLDGVDEFISRAFHDDDATWARVVCAREAACAGCGRTIGAGQEAHVRGPAERRQFRCLECGVPGEHA